MPETDGLISASPEGGVGRAKPQIFISYGREDGLTFTERLVHDLATDYDAVYDSPHLLAGSAWIPQLDEAIFSSQAVIAVLTPSAVRYAKDSPEKGDSFCHNETRAALNAKIPVLLVRPQDCKIPTHLNTQHCIDFKHLGYSAALAQLRRSIGALITDGSAPTAPTQGIRDEWSLAPSFQWVLDKHKTFYGRQSLFGEIDAWRCRSDAGRMLLITGLAGAGKSSIAVQLVNEQCCGHVLAYHFCRYEDLNTLRPINFIRNLAVTLAQEFPAYRELLAEPRAQAELARLSDDDDKDKPESLLESVILEPMQTIIPPREFADKPALIIIDALDEAVRFARDGGTNSIVDLIVEELPRLPSWLRVVATCRPGTDTAHRLGMLSENGHALVESMPLGARSNDTDLDVCIEQQFAAVGKSAPSEDVRSLIRTSSNGNFQFLTLLLHRLIKDAGTEDEMIAMIRRTPPGLNALYHAEFVRLYGAFASEPSWDLARRLLGMLVVAREPLSTGLLSQALDVGDKDLARELRRLDGYLEEQNGSYLIGHKSVSDWLLDAHDAMDFALDEPGCHAIAADLCWKAFEGVRKRTVKANFVRLADDEVSRYVVLYGVVHCLLAGRLARAVALIHFIVRNFDESRVEGTRFVLLSPARLTRLLLREIDDCSDAEKRAINPTQLAYLIKNFYQVEPLSAPLRMLIGYHANEWFDIRKELLSADNYVVRFSTSEALADSYFEAESPRGIARVHEDLASDDINVSELGAYTLRHIYARDPDLVRPEDLELLANSETYPARSALGDLLLNLTFQDCPYAEEVTSARFWEPVWDHNRLDVWDIKAAPAFRAGEPLTPDADAGTQNAYRHFQRAQSLRQRMRGVAELGRNKVVACLIEEDDFFRLGSNPELISDAEETLQDSPYLSEMMGILFAHPLWNVAETAASVLTSIIERDERHKTIVNSLFEHRYWRVQFGAIEAAYQLAATDRMVLFGKAVRRFYAHENSRVRALCAENLIAYILDRPADLREFYLRPPDKEAKSNNPDISFHAEIERWLKDTDCWVLEHVFRLLKTLDRDRSPRAGQSTTSSRFFANGMPPLLDGLPRSDWDRLPRETFLKHIEARKRELMPAV